MFVWQWVENETGHFVDLNPSANFTRCPWNSIRPQSSGGLRVFACGISQLTSDFLTEEPTVRCLRPEPSENQNQLVNSGSDSVAGH